MKKIKTVFIDLDGVVVDCLKGLREIAGKPDSIFDEWRKNPELCNHDSADILFGGKDKFSEIQKSMTVEQWLNLDIFPYANYLINTIRENYPIAFLSSFGHSPNAGTGKILWQQKFYPDIPLVLTRFKSLCASETKVLIDDDDKQLNHFEDNGGLAIRFPNQFQFEKMPNNDCVKYIVNDILRLIKQQELRINNLVDPSYSGIIYEFRHSI